ncbi:hypothetical protein PIB30_063210 [Stylosanthes scabra]|uniref:Uncharacterized protein n=1 Tax=Stylosanthes scabra TaxID=79078 RepID=A0ABU6YNY2_9FABA|nr:hypothetical protein [Stylosanthes scabra]
MKRSRVPPTLSSQIIPVPPPEPSNVQSDASSGTKISEGDVPLPKASDPKETQPTPLPTYSVSSDSASTHSQQISPISRRPKSLKSSQRKLRRKRNQKGSKKILMHPPPILILRSGLNQLPQRKHNLLQNQTPLMNLQEVNRTIEEEPIMDQPVTPANQYSISAEVLNSLYWLIDLLNAPIDQNVDHEVVQQKAELVTAHFRKHYVPEEAAPVEGVPLLVKNLVNTASNLKKCQNRVVDLGKDLKLLDKTTSDYDKVKSQLSIEVDSANDKLLGLNQQKLKLEKELASIQRQIKEVEDQKERLEGPLSRSKQGLKKIDDKLASIADQKKTT